MARPSTGSKLEIARMFLLLLALAPGVALGQIDHPAPTPVWDPYPSANADSLSCYNPVRPASESFPPRVRTVPAYFNTGPAMGRDCVFPFEIKQSDGTLRRYNSCDYAHTTPDATEFWQEGCAVVNTTELAVPLNKTCVKTGDCGICWCPKTCTCPAGWAGFNCSACVNDGKNGSLWKNGTNSSRCLDSFADISAVRSTSATCQVTGTLKSMLSGSSQISLGTFDFDPSEKTATLSTLRITAYCRDPYLMRCAAQSCALHRDESAQCGKYGAPCVACETASCEMGVTQFSSDLGFLKQLLQRVKGKSIFSCKDAEKKCVWHNDDLPIDVELSQCITGYLSPAAAPPHHHIGPAPAPGSGGGLGASWHLQLFLSITAILLLCCSGAGLAGGLCGSRAAACCMSLASAEGPVSARLRRLVSQEKPLLRRRSSSYNKGGSSGAAAVATAGSGTFSPRSGLDLQLAFTDVGCRVEDRMVLQSVEGVVNTTERSVFAILGASGSGKSTLLDIIAGRKRASGSVSTTGQVSVNGQALSPAQRRRALGYVTQEDALLPVLSVRETIAFSVNVRLSGAVSRSERDRRVTDAIHALGLDTVADSRIGAAGETGGISGGERRRVSIAAELVVDPLVLLLDEPTSGLDSASAAVVMQRLDGLAKRRRLVIASIHAPRPDVFASFGRILLLSGGRPAYLGPASEAEARFAACGLQCPAAMNIADYLLEATAGDATEALRQLAELPVGRESADLGDVLVESGEAVAESKSGAPGRKARLSINRVPSELLDQDGGPYGAIATGRCCRCCRSSLVCCRRSQLLCGRTLKTTFRGPFLVFLHFVTALVLGPVFGALYSTIPNDISGVQNRVGAFFLMQVLWCTLSMSALDMWNEEAHLVSRQRAAGYYSVGAYFAAKAAVDVFFLRVLPPALFAFIFYWVAGFGHDVDKFVVFGSILVLTSLVFGAICMLIGALCSSTRVANVVATLVLLFSLLFGGFLVHAGESSPLMQACFDLSPLFFACEAMMANEFADLDITFNPVGSLAINGTQGTTWLSNFGFDKSRLAPDLHTLIGVSCLYLALAYAALTARFHNWLHPCDIVWQRWVGALCTRLARRASPGGSKHKRLRPSGLPTSSPGHDSTAGCEGGEGKREQQQSDAPTRGHENRDEAGDAGGGAIPIEVVEKAADAAPTAEIEQVPVVLSVAGAIGRVATNGLAAAGSSGDSRTILDVASLHMSSAERSVFAIMGASGSGKSTLLDIIAGRKSPARRALGCGCGPSMKWHAAICINGQALSPAQRRRALGYVTQEDALLPVLSVRETIAFSVNVRLSGAVSRSERDRRVTDAIHALGLDTVADSRIGAAGETGGISGGERRRVSIAAELVVDPLVLLLDEPTSGLDSASAAVVMQRLDGLAKRRRLVIASIHAPRPDVFASFGRILLLSGGRPAYLGPASEAEARFAACGLPRPERVNPADHLLDALAGHAKANASLFAAAEKAMTATPPDVTTLCVAGANRCTPATACSCGPCRQLGPLCVRSGRIVIRSRGLFFAHVMSAVGFGLLLGAVYHGLAVDVAGLQNRTGGLFTILAFSLLTGLSAVGAWADERAV